MSGLLVVAGEGSGDRIAASALRELRDRDLVSFGLGGTACRAAGMRIVADASSTAAMGISDVARRAPAILGAVRALLDAARRDRPDAALLVDFTELNALLGRWLRARGVRVLWCVAPQVWAWRRSRLRTLGRSLDRLAVVLPFEEPLWRAHGVDARYVGHPALEVPSIPRIAARARLGIVGDARAIGLLPGSRAGEVRRIAPVLAAAARRLLDDRDVDEAVLLEAPALDAAARAALRDAGRSHGVRVAAADPEHGAAPLLGALDAVVCASGTASLEAALAGVPVAVAHRLDPLAWAVARRLVHAPHVALPNVIVGVRAVPELLQRDATPEAVAAAARTLLGAEAKPRATALASRLRSTLSDGDGRPFGARLAALLDDWLAAAATR